MGALQMLAKGLQKRIPDRYQFVDEHATDLLVPGIGQ